jgi:hypothetical protein
MADNRLELLTTEGELTRRASVLALALAVVLVELNSAVQEHLLAALGDFRNEFTAAGREDFAEAAQWCIKTFSAPPTKWPLTSRPRPRP